ncbi:hypothetical protein [Glutamicibacter sp. NPDC087344]|uniref:hypothetical protein n=1 Tax=Glutamicibacter sp. NPDC087344 TaxID=3363994 RepID=UPI00382BA96E
MDNNSAPEKKNEPPRVQYKYPNDAAIMAEVRRRQAALIVKLDKRLGRETPEHIVELATKTD